MGKKAARLVLVGEAPSRDRNGCAPLEGRSAKVLSRAAGIPVERLLAQTERVNLLQRWPGAAGKGSRFPAARARRAARRLAPLLAGRTVLLMGKRVAGAFGSKAPFFSWSSLAGFQAATFPHPSGVSHFWNDPADRARASSFLRRAFRLQPWRNHAKR